MNPIFDKVYATPRFTGVLPKKHIGLYPVPIGNGEFNEELSVYKAGKGTLRFPLDQPIPFNLVSKIVKVRVKENLERAAAEGKKK
jgi:uncharacterized protein YdhG (YjbR/CyaY superfamily)